MGEFLTPRLIITDYYDSLINQLDIYIEEQIKRAKAEILPRQQQDSYFYSYQFKNPYKPDSKKKQRINAKEVEHKYLEVRQKTIDAIKKVRDENLKLNNNTNKETTKIDRQNLTNENLEELKSQLFSNGYCFLLDFEHLDSTNRKSESLLTFQTVITDFYLRESDIDHIKFNTKYNRQQSNKIFDQRFFVADQLAKYLKYEHSNGFEVIHVKQSSLFDLEHIGVTYFRKFDDFDFRFDIDFSAIKSLSIDLNYDRISDFSAFANLEYLSIKRAFLCERPFENLHKLIKIKIHSCDLSQFDFDSLNSIVSLQIIDIELDIGDGDEKNRQCSLKIDLNRLINLKSLEFDLHKDNGFELILNSSNQLTKLILKGKPIDFSKQLDLKQLKCLNITNVDLSRQISQQSFNGISSLIELYLCNSNLTNVDFIDTHLLEKLEVLDLSHNKLSVLRKGTFSKLKSLKSLNLSCNQIEELLPGTFKGLECLEYLYIKSNRFVIQSIDNAVFDGLKRLECLYIKHFTRDDDVAHLKRDCLIVC